MVFTAFSLVVINIVVLVKKHGRKVSTPAVSIPAHDFHQTSERVEESMDLESNTITPEQNKAYVTHTDITTEGNQAYGTNIDGIVTERNQAYTCIANNVITGSESQSSAINSTKC